MGIKMIDSECRVLRGAQVGGACQCANPGFAAFYILTRKGCKRMSKVCEAREELVVGSLSH